MVAGAAPHPVAANVEPIGASEGSAASSGGLWQPLVAIDAFQPLVLQALVGAKNAAAPAAALAGTECTKGDVDAVLRCNAGAPPTSPGIGSSDCGRGSAEVG